MIPSVKKKSTNWPLLLTVLLIVAGSILGYMISNLYLNEQQELRQRGKYKLFVYKVEMEKGKQTFPKYFSVYHFNDRPRIDYRNDGTVVVKEDDGSVLIIRADIVELRKY